MRLSITFIALLTGLVCFSHNDSILIARSSVRFSGFADVFYAYDFNKPASNIRQGFLYNHNRHNEVNLNLGFIKASYERQFFRANIALQAGTYVEDNYAAEPDLVKNLFEANFGIALNENKNLWLDAGIFSSHIGFESAVSADNWTLTRSLLAENSPYYLAGVKLTYSPDERWRLAGIICNGWQRIRMVSGNSLPSFGTQVEFTPSKYVSLNWSTFIGTDDPDIIRRIRIFNNFYGKWEINEKVGVITGLDIGAQQKQRGSSQHDLWFSPILITRYAIAERWNAAFRAEYYQDSAGIIIPTETLNGYKTSGLSLNLDYSMAKVFCRLEGRWLNSKDRIFEQKNELLRNNVFVVTSIALKID
jgi:hypothetical protein